MLKRSARASSPRVKALLILIIEVLIVFSFVFLVNRNNVINVSAVEADGVGVYWDGGCTRIVYSIDWGTLSPGSVKNVILYVRNEGEEPIYLNMLTRNWSPSIAFRYIKLKWDCSGRFIDPGEVLQATLALSVSYLIEGVSNFGFDILISRSNPGDLNFDGVVNVLDVLIVGFALRSRLGDPKWNPIADINDDGVVNVLDIVIVAVNFGKTV